MQPQPQYLQVSLLEDTVDLDIEKCKFSLLPQMLTRLELLDGDLFEQEITTIKNLGCPDTVQNMADS